jgi:hypothetical protein
MRSTLYLDSTILGCVSAIDSNGRTIWIADAHRDDGKRFVVRAEELLTASIDTTQKDRAPLIRGLCISAL